MNGYNIDVFPLLKNLLASDKVERNPLLREIVFLGYGTMVYKYCNETAACPAELIKVI